MASHDVPALRSVIMRTTAIRIVLAGVAVALVVAAAASARDPATSERALIPQDRVGIVVLDLSLSITDTDYTAIRRTLRRIVAEEASIGLVVFSDVPYELLPPGTPAKELTPFLRLLIAPRLGPVQNPWTQTFRAGTRISVALDLAKSMLERDEIESGSILLVSDLETAPDDVPALARTVAGIDQSGIRLRIVPLGPSSDALTLFGGTAREGRVGRVRPAGAGGRAAGRGLGRSRAPDRAPRARRARLPLPRGARAVGGATRPAASEPRDGAAREPRELIERSLLGAGR